MGCPTLCIFALLLLTNGQALLAQTAPPLQVRPFHEVALPAIGTAPAQVFAPNDSLLSAEVSARIDRIAASVGARVKGGDVLVYLDDTDYRLALAQAEAQVAAAQARIALAKQRQHQTLTLRQRQFVSDDTVLEVQTAVQAAEAELAVAQAQRAVAARAVEKCRITAPFTGIVLERQAQLGALATPGTALVRLVDLAAPEIEAQIPEVQADELTRATSLVLEHQGQRYPVRLLRLSPIVDKTARTRLARLAFADARYILPAGSHGLLHWELPLARLPADLLVKRGGTLGAFISDNGRARFLPVTDAQEGRPFPLAVPPTTLVVVVGQHGLSEGQLLPNPGKP